jgi:hypothetical protein
MANQIGKFGEPPMRAAIIAHLDPAVRATIEVLRPVSAQAASEVVPARA